MGYRLTPQEEGAAWDHVRKELYAARAELAKVRADLQNAQAANVGVGRDLAKARAERDQAVRERDAARAGHRGTKGDREVSEQRLPIKIEFDFTNKITAFGVATIPSHDDEKAVRSITVNMAAILWACADDPTLAWKEVTSEVVIHEVLHHVQDALGVLLKESDVEEAIEAARDMDDAQVEAMGTTLQEFDPYTTTLARAEHAEAKVLELLALLKAARAECRAWREWTKTFDRTKGVPTSRTDEFTPVLCRTIEAHDAATPGWMEEGADRMESGPQSGL